jgi:hypothetical protein
MASRTDPRSFDSFIGAYGPQWRSGVLTEHLGWGEGVIRVVQTAGGAQWAIPAGGGRAVPLVCSDLISVPTEDGPITGRCGVQVRNGRMACEGHHDEREHWSSLSELERLHQEQREDREDFAR